MHAPYVPAVLVAALACLTSSSPIELDLPNLPASPINVGGILNSVKTSPLLHKDKREPLDLSIPKGLIPSIPGVTEPLASNAPPLPVLQLPVPPVESEPFTPSDIRPKKIGYFWTGAGDNIHKDFLVTASLDDVSSTNRGAEFPGDLPSELPVLASFFRRWLTAVFTGYIRHHH